MTEQQVVYHVTETCSHCGAILGSCENHNHEPCPECERYRALLAEIMGCSTLKKAWAVAEGGLT